MSAPKDKHRGWLIEQNWTGMWEATGPDFDASYEGPEDGWVGNGQSAFGRTRDEVVGSIDDWFAEQGQ